MFRAILYLIAIVLIISVVRSVIGILMKAVSNLASPQATPAARQSVPTAGELKKDPVCGTFISASTQIQKRIGDTTYYFCSPECREKFKG